VVAIAVCTLVLGWRSLVAERQTIDDAFIFLRYARNLATQGRYAFDAAEAPWRVPVEGTSSPAWTALLALAFRAGAPGLGSAKAVSLAIGLLVPTTCALAVRRLRGGLLAPPRPLLLAIPALALALDADLATWIVSGMDTAAWTLACLGCVMLVAMGRDRAAAVLLGALACVRPEGPLFTAFGVLALARDRRALLRLAVLAAIPIAAITLWRVATFHDVVPNTFWAKMNAADGKDYTGAGYLASALARRPLLLLVFPVAAVRAAAPSERRGGGVGNAHPRDASSPVRLAAALLVASFAFALVAGGDWMPGRRLLVVALPLGAVLAACAVARARPLLAAAASLALVAEAALTTDHAIDQDWREHEWLDERVTRWLPSARPFVDPYALDWMPTHLLGQIAPYVGPGDTVAHVDVGELPYVMRDVSFLDGFGLVDREAGRLAFSPHDPGLRAAARAAFFGVRPAAAIVVVDEATGHPFSPAQDAATADPRFAEGWRELARVPTWGGHPCVTYVRRDVRAADEVVSSARVRAWLGAVPDVLPSR
jgi:hypothetical protein